MLGYENGAIITKFRSEYENYEWFKIIYKF